MEEKITKEIDQTEELESVNGGSGSNIQCPNCGTVRSVYGFNPERRDSGCSSGCKYSCPACGYQWTE